MWLRRRPPTGDREAGLTLIELVVAVLVLSIGALAALRAGDQSVRALAGAEPRLLAMLVAENRAEELRLFGPGAALPDTVQMGGQGFDVSAVLEGTAGGMVQATITVRSAAGPGALLVAVLPGPRVPQ